MEETVTRGRAGAEVRRAGKAWRNVRPEAVVTTFVLVVGLLLVTSFVIRDVASSDTTFLDLRVYRLGAEHALEGDLYDTRLRRGGLPYTYTPFAAVVTFPLSIGPFAAAAFVWTLLNLACLLGLVLLVVRASGLRHGLLVSAGAVLALLMLEPVRSNLAYGQVNLVLMFLIIYDVARRRGRWTGVLVGVAAGIKLTPLIFLVFFALTGRGRAALTGALAFLSTVAIGFAVMPVEASRYWTDLIWDPDRVGGVAYASNQSILGLLTRASGGEPTQLVWLFIAGGVSSAILALAVVVWRRGARLDALLSVATTGLAMLFASPISWSHHWVWICPVIVVLACSGGRSRRVASALVFVVFAVGMIWRVPSGDDREYQWGPVESLLGNSYLVTAVVVCLLIARELKHPGTRRVEVTGPDRTVPVDDSPSLPQSGGRRRPAVAT